MVFLKYSLYRKDMFEFFLIIYQFSKWVGFTAHKMINKFFEVSLWIQEFRHIWYISPLLLLLLFNFSHLWPRAASLYCLMSHLIQSQTSLIVPLPFFFWKDIPISSFTFLVPDLQSVYPPRNPDHFYWEMMNV